MRLVPIAADFYERLFKADPSLKAMFADDMAPQVAKLAQTLSYAVTSLNDRDTLRRDLHLLGRTHRDLGVKAGHYPLVTEALIAALAYSFGPGWRPEVERAWRQLLGFVGAVMLEGSRKAQAPRRKSLRL